MYLSHDFVKSAPGFDNLHSDLRAIDRFPPVKRWFAAGAGNEWWPINKTATGTPS